MTFTASLAIPAAGLAGHHSIKPNAWLVKSSPGGEEKGEGERPDICHLLRRRHRAHGDGVAGWRERVVAAVRTANIDLPPLRAGGHQADVVHRKIRRGIRRRIAPVRIEVRAHPHLPEGW